MSFNIANSGLSAITQQLDSISNNIANSATTGYKSSRAEFASLYTQAKPLGVAVTKVTESITRGGGISATGNNLDLAISGNGFFVVKGNDNTMNYTRAGYFGFDKNGYIINNQEKRLQGYPIDKNNNLKVGTVSDLSVTSGMMPAKSTDRLNFIANFNADEKVPSITPFDSTKKETYNQSYTTEFNDSLGRSHTFVQYFVKSDDNKWKVHYGLDGSINSTPIEVEFNTSGMLTKPTTAPDLTFTITGAQDLKVEMDYTGTTQFGSAFSVSSNKATGYTSGERNGLQIEKDGMVYATFSNGERLLQGQVILANFSNPNGLMPQDGTAWSETNDSGNALLGIPGIGLLGAIKSSSLEGSNVDMTTELVNLMTAQRNYQANTKVISTNDQMMQALFQAV